MDAIDLERNGVRGDRRFYLVDEEGVLVSAKRVPVLLTVRPEVENGRLALHFPDGATVDGDVELGAPVKTLLYGRSVAGRGCC